MKKLKRSLLIVLAVLLLVIPTQAASTSTKKVNLKNGKIITSYVIKGTHKVVKFNISGSSYKWKTSKPSVATVTKKGVVTIKNKGTTLITATKKGKTYKCKLIVESPKLSKSSVILTQGSRTKLSVSGTKQPVKWKSLNPRIAKVSSAGYVQGISSGSTKVQAIVGNVKTFSCKVIVRKKSITPVIIIPAKDPTPTPVPTKKPVIIITRPSPTPKPTQAPSVINPSGSTQTVSQKNAIAKANSYLSHSAFSKEGLVGQLMYEGFSEADSRYAVNNISVNWYDQALKKAKSYLSHSAFSYNGLIEQLEYEEFTSAEAAYGVSNCGANWYEQAAKKAASYLSHSSFSHSGLVDQLIYEGFTAEQAEYGVTQNGL